MQENWSSCGPVYELLSIVVLTMVFPRKVGANDLSRTETEHITNTKHIQFLPQAHMKGKKESRSSLLYTLCPYTPCPFFIFPFFLFSFLFASFFLQKSSNTSTR